MSAWSTSSVPVLFIAFNRPGLTKRTMQRIAECRPSRLFVALDGPRPGEEAVCAEVASIATSVDWPCELEVLQRPTNLGCREAVGSALDWFFDRVEAGVVIEDDVLIDPTYLTFAAELLDRYRDDPRVGMISAVNPLGSSLGESSYFFGHPGVWGWASWRRAWRQHDRGMGAWADAEARARASRYFGPALWRRRAGDFEDTFLGRVDTWDYAWVFTLAHTGALCAVPRVNLVENLGFGAGATHTLSVHSAFSSLKSAPCSFPLVHPDRFELDRDHLRRVADMDRTNLVSRAIRRIADPVRNKRAGATCSS